ncbi:MULTISPECIES: hypothetical protein [Mycobacteroides]|nr:MULTISPECIES: hypothetical protein [Mycobacteroides]MBF9327938.1 hypothetical protein [Mycobacteroides chelonae]MBF9422116.1 hypothetical protein [Mycobacteroides chelonae]
MAESTSDALFRWDVSLMDVGVSDDESCPWTWRLEPQELQELMQFLADCSCRKWAELEADRTGGKERHKKHHDHPIADICREGRERFYQSVSDESHDKLFRLRYGGKQRLWGIRDRAIFRIVWADVHHKVYPTEPS